MGSDLGECVIPGRYYKIEWQPPLPLVNHHESGCNNAFSTPKRVGGRLSISSFSVRLRMTDAAPNSWPDFKMDFKGLSFFFLLSSPVVSSSPSSGLPLFCCHHIPVSRHATPLEPPFLIEFYITRINELHINLIFFKFFFIAVMNLFSFLYRICLLLKGMKIWFDKFLYFHCHPLS